MKNKRLFILAIAAATSFSACDLLGESNNKEDDVVTNNGFEDADSNNPSSDNSKKDETKETGKDSSKTEDKEETKPGENPSQDPIVPDDGNKDPEQGDDVNPGTGDDSQGGGENPGQGGEVDPGTGDNTGDDQESGDDVNPGTGDEPGSGDDVDSGTGDEPGTGGGENPGTDPVEPQDPQEPQEPQEPEDEIEKASLDTSEVELQPIMDTSKQAYSVNWKVDNKIVRTDTNIPRGEYIEPDALTLYPQLNKTSSVDGKNYVFKGWAREENSNKAYTVDQLAPVVRDTTYYAQYELAESYKLTLNFKIGGKAAAGDNDSKATNYDPNYKLELFVPKENKIVLSKDVLDLFPTYNLVSSIKEASIKSTDIVTIDYDSTDEDVLQKYSYDYDYKSTWFADLFDSWHMPDYWSNLTEDEDNYDGFSLFNLPVIKSDLTLNIWYVFKYDNSTVRFISDGDELYSTTYIRNGGSGQTVGSYISTLKKDSIARNLSPVRVKNGKKYNFLGWNTDPNATSGKVITELTENFEVGNITYYAIFSTTNYQSVCLYADPKFGSTNSPVSLSFDELINKNAIRKDSNGNINLNSSVLAGQNMALTKAKYPKIYFSFPDDKGIKSISNFAYETITSISLPSSLESIASGAFASSGSYSNDNLTTIYNKSSKLTTIPANAFNGVKTLNTLEGFSSVTTIGEKAFYNCPNLRFANNNTINFASIGQQAFAGVNASESAFDLKIGSSVRTIGESAFANRNIKNLTFAEGVTTIKQNAFEYCPIEKVSLPASLTDVSGANQFPAFHLCNTLSQITISSSNTKYYSDKNCIVLKDNDNGDTLIHGTKGTIISSKVKRIKAYSFNNSSITKLKIPNTVTYIEPGAFDNSAITRIDFDGTAKEFLAINHKDNGFVFVGDHKLSVYCSDGILVR